MADALTYHSNGSKQPMRRLKCLWFDSIWLWFDRERYRSKNLIGLTTFGGGGGGGGYAIVTPLVKNTKNPTHSLQ